MLVVFTFLACDEAKEDPKTNFKHSVPNKAKFRLEVLGGLKIVPLNGGVTIHIKPADSSLIGKEVFLSVDGDSIQVASIGQKVEVIFKDVKLGLHDVEVKMADGYKKSIRIEVLSNTVPNNLSYKIEKSYKHDISAYTQGLEFSEGELYEGTGLRNGESMLRRVDLISGEPLSQIRLKSEDFGEGITVFDNMVFQLTWQNQIAYCYDKETFKLLDEFRYPQGISEGWGLTHNSDNLIMSDGTNRIHFLDASTFLEERFIDVYDNHGAVGQLNELEYIDGLIYANIYTTDKIAQIDPESGAVIGYIDMAGLLSDKDRMPGTDVLNGIAYNRSTNKIYVTGKRWPKLFEVKFIPKT